ncbi:MAG: DNA mismatch repair protein MutL, partial [Armatimonadota bacterium]
VEESPIPEVDTSEIRTVALKGAKLIGQAKNMYMIAECDDGIIIIDQHIAHERVLYESFLKDKEEKKTIQMLVMPVSLSLSQRESKIVSEKLEDIQKSGFILEPFGKDTFLIRGVPASIKLKDAESVLKDIIDELVDFSISKHIIVKQDQVLITSSCKMAVKAGDSLSFDELQKLLNDLLKCDNPFVCPHGRPIIVSLSNWELERKFHRR